MKNTLSLTLALLAGLSSGALLIPDSDAQAASAPVTQDGALPERVQAMETQLVEMEKALKKSEALLEQTITYLEDQSKSAAELANALGEAERLGFTKGINFHSREVLLRGFRGLVSEMQRNVPRLQTRPTATAQRTRAVR